MQNHGSLGLGLDVGIIDKGKEQASEEEEAGNVRDLNGSRCVS
jgi:hypothetical protein